MALLALPATAQLGVNKQGYYRVRNVMHPTHYIGIANDYFSYQTLVGSSSTASQHPDSKISQASAWLRNDVHIYDDEYISPATVFYIMAQSATSSSNKNYNLIAQGTSVRTLATGKFQGSIMGSFTFDKWVVIEKVDGDGDNAKYRASVQLKNNTGIGTMDLGYRFFRDSILTNGNPIFYICSDTEITDAAYWNLIPITYFNILPDFKYNGKYYTTLKVPYQWKIADNSSVEKVFVITGVTDGKLQYQELTGTIPEGTPVILECNSSDPLDCKLTLLGIPKFPDASTSNQTAPSADEASYYTGSNLLKGTYYCNTDGRIPYLNTSGGISAYTHNNYTAPTNLFELKPTNGKLGFVTAQGITMPTYSYDSELNPTSAGTIKAMPANKAWMEEAGEFNIIRAVATPVISPEGGTYEGVQVSITCSDTANGAIIHYTTDGSEPSDESPVYSGTFVVNESTTVKAIAILPGLQANSTGFYLPSEVASATYTIEVPEPKLTAMPTALAINDDEAGTFTVTGTDLGTDNVGVTRTNTDFVPSLTASVGTATNGQYWYFTPSGGSVQGMVSMTYQGRALRASATVSVGSYVITADPVEVTYKSNIYIAGDYGDGWSFSNCPQMSENGNIYTATVTITNTNSYIAFVRKATLGENERWNTRYLFTPQSSGNWEMDQNEKGGNINLSGSQPIHFQSPGTYTITIDATDAEHPTFNIVKAEETPLVNIVNDGTVGKQYTIADDVMAIYIASKEPTRVYAKDDNNHRYPTATSTGIDYVKSRARLQSGDWDQSNWVVLEFATAQEASQFVNGDNKGVIRGGTLTGELIDKLNPTMRVTAYQSPSAMQMQFTGYDENNYVTSNFMSELVQTGLVSGNTYFFIQPKAQEYARVNWAMLDGNAHFSVPNNQQGSNSDGLAGSFDADWSLYPGNAATDFETGLTYVFHAIVRYTTDGAALRAPRRDASEGGYVVYPLEGGENTITAVVENWSDARPVQVKYVNAMGVMSDEPFEGLNIVVTRYSDGTTRSSKQAFNK